MDRFLVFIIGVPLAFVILYFRRRIRDFVGDVWFAEKFLGAGGTNTFIVIVGILVFVASVMYGLGTLQELLQSTVGKLFPPR